ncbi:MAG: FAD:protein FMN transferase [Pirellulales bacterium]
MSDPQRPSRRDLLSGRAVQRLAQSSADSAAAQAAAARRRPPAYLIHVARTAMACEFEVMLNAGQYPEGPDAALQALDLVERLEEQLTVYRDHSEVSRLNASAFERAVEVEPRLFALLQQAKQLHADTGGAFDITSGPLSKTWGFFRRAGRLPNDVEIQQALERVGSQHLELDETRRSVRFLRAGLEINLGSIGKGYALDRCVEFLWDAGVQDFLLHGGTSSIVGRGTRAGLLESETGWIVALRHALRPDQKLAEIRLRDRALGTSGSGSQFFFHQGRRYGHILDPRTGRPADRVVSATVLAPTAAQADALATSFYVLGLEATAEYCAARPEIGALLVVAGAKAGAAAVERFNLGDDEVRLETGPVES